MALHTVSFNFVKMHKTLRMTPAVAAGLSGRLCSMSAVAALVEPTAAKPGKHGPYNKAAAEISN